MCVCEGGTAGAMLGGHAPLLPFPGPSVSIRQKERPPCPRGPQSIRPLVAPHVYPIMVHYLGTATRKQARKKLDSKEKKMGSDITKALSGSHLIIKNCLSFSK